MDINDLSARLKRLYYSIDAIVDDKLDGYHVGFDPRSLQPLLIDKLPPDERQLAIEERVINVIHGLASLRDHLKVKIGEQIVNEYVHNHPKLGIVIDLDNAEKHGDYKLSNSRAKRGFRIVGVKMSTFLRQGAMIMSKAIIRPLIPEQIVSGQRLQTKKEILEYSVSGFEVRIEAQVIDANNNPVISFEKLVTDAMAEWQALIDLHIKPAQ